jgi:hypothetical protein
MSEETHTIPSAAALFEQLQRAEFGRKHAANVMVQVPGLAERIRNRSRMAFEKLRRRPYHVLGGIIVVALFLLLGWVFQFGVIFSFIWAGIVFLISLITGLLGHVSNFVSWLFSLVKSHFRSNPVEATQQ